MDLPGTMETINGQQQFVGLFRAIRGTIDARNVRPSFGHGRVAIRLSPSLAPGLATSSDTRSSASGHQPALSAERVDRGTGGFQGDLNHPRRRLDLTVIPARRRSRQEHPGRRALLRSPAVLPEPGESVEKC